MRPRGCAAGGGPEPSGIETSPIGALSPSAISFRPIFEAVFFSAALASCNELSAKTGRRAPAKTERNKPERELTAFIVSLSLLLTREHSYSYRFGFFAGTVIP